MSDAFFAPIRLGRFAGIITQCGGGSDVRPCSNHWPQLKWTSDNAEQVGHSFRLAQDLILGGTWLYPSNLGILGRTAEMLFTGEFLEAEDAYRPGFLNRKDWSSTWKRR